MRNIEIDINKTDVVVKAPASRTPLLTQLPAMAHHRTTDTWHCPHSSMLRLATLLPADAVTFSPQALELLAQERLNLATAIKIKQGEIPGDDFLMYQQITAVELAEIYNSYAFFMDTGTGKTITGLEIIKRKGGKWLVICPKSVVNLGWVKDATDFYKELRVLPDTANLTKKSLVALATQWGEHIPGMNKAKILQVLRDRADIIVVNPARFVNNVRTFTAGMCGIIVDESTMIKNPTAQRTKVITNAAAKLKYTYILTGKPGNI